MVQMYWGNGRDLPFKKHGSAPNMVFTSPHSDRHASSKDGCEQAARNMNAGSFIFTPDTGLCSIGTGNNWRVSYGMSFGGHVPRGDWYVKQSYMETMRADVSTAKLSVLLASVSFVIVGAVVFFAKRRSFPHKSDTAPLLQVV